MSLAGKVAVVTGGSRGIGRAVCLRFAAMGAKVVINYVSRPDAAEETKAQVEALGGECYIVQFDVASASEVQEAFKQITAECGRIDILVCNAGITRDGLLATMKEEDWDQVMSVNLKGAFNCIKAGCRPMMKQRWGRIIIITSVVGFAGNAGQANYAAAKAGLVGLTRSAARELASRFITVNCVAPGYIATDMTGELPEKVKEKILAEIPLGILGAPEDIAAAAAYLASDDAKYVTGQAIHVNGGMFMG
ncbi:MAG: 3-oxoacyl-[acyl-carrier-protein] reductase [Deltaproteobacteria bacterium]|jgi:3-oxoacyl-[acyl-carrier protein] reductase|nr:3-oxoacyl-[acyl-carrier-protein] reductase [Deltaproteobacteria bacterium]